MTTDTKPVPAEVHEALARTLMARRAAIPLRWDTRQARAALWAEIHADLDRYLEATS